jgi:hypothetical protein
MSSLRHIVTHPGGAHKDDFLACAVLLARHPVVLERRDPTPEDLEDATVAVVDVGHRHEPALANFDHHQFSRDAVPTCALSLLLKWMDRYEQAREFCDWLEMAEWLDCRGAFGTARQFGFEPELLNQLLSPIDVTLLRRFACSEKLGPGDTLWEVMRWIGSDLLEYLESLHGRMAELETRAQWWTLEVGGGPVRVLFLPRIEPAEEDPSAGLDRFIARQDFDEAVIGMVSPDRRGTGYGLSRYNDDRRLDFTRILEEADVHFAHANGFVAKTSATDPDRLRGLVEASLLAAP